VYLFAYIRGCTVDRFILGERIATLRDEIGLNQTQLGMLCGGWSKSRIGNYEKGERSPNPDDLLIIIDAFKNNMGATGNDAYFYIFTGKKIPEFLVESNYKTPFVNFTPADAIKVMEGVVDVSAEVGIVRFDNKHKPSELMALFSKKCYEAFSSSNSQKDL
jgi:transcriptional regulator with XRE-family HTH domain